MCNGGKDSKNGDVVVNLGSVALSHALADPNDVPTLLLLQLEEGVEDPKVELLHEGVLVQPHLKWFDCLLRFGKLDESFS